MGVPNYEEKTNRIAIPRGSSGAGCGGKNFGNSKGGSGRGCEPSELREKVRPNTRGCLSSGKPSVRQGESAAPRLRKSHSSAAQSPGLHSAEMGSGKPKGFRQMKTLVIANQKGGVGKTATVVHLAFDFFESKGLRVALIDLDTQANASYTLNEYDSGCTASQLFDQGPDNIKRIFSSLPEGPVLSLISSDPLLANMEKRSVNDASKAFGDNIKALLGFFDVVLVDTAPSLGVGMAAALCSADYVLSPIELEAYSIQGIKKMLTTVANIRKVNPKLQFLGMMPSKVDARNPRHKRHLDELQAAYPQLMIPARIGLRSSIADALANCVPVWKIKKTAARKAAQEVREVSNFVYESIGISENNVQLARGAK